MSGKKKILFVINSLNCGGAEKSLVSLLPLIDDSQYDIYLQMFNIGGMFMDLLPDTVKILPEIKFISFARGGLKEQITSFRLHYLWIRLKLFLDLRYNRKRRKLHDAQVWWKACRSAVNKDPNSYDVAIAWGQGNPTHYVAEKVSAGKKLAWINADYTAVGYNKEFDQPIYKTYDKIISVSDKLLEIMRGVFPKYANKMDRVLDIQNCHLIEKMAQLPISEGEKKSWRLVTVGRMVFLKGYDIAVDAAKQIREKGIDFEWIFVGEGPERNTIQEKIRKLNLEDTVFCVGAKSNPYPYIYSADIYVQTSRAEGYCLTLAEARTLNKPIVTTEFGVVYEQMVNGENGLVVPTDAQAVADGIQRLMEDRILYDHIVQYLSREKKGNQEEIEKFYELIEA